ncbi:hypothetical protein A2W14_04915 [Candidatus Gottesmanbacteria bacterium RBG_16_37_8]|uniref:SpoVT-AbrB domain-containing protein n=1 Tax=Candidatus Gottesmanbacteria bacterium RBG_16_37_8 TaxID=1798371 RepID=A0A1F5YUS7_9BACT|nr:MAG: hypothetical protein A2W14_04915 [Candidatus Gottesmanbacteria bacterium RBG_16_37_8]
MTNQVKYVKSFSKGQITIPKEFREVFGMTDEFWLRLYIKEGKIIAEPVEREKNKKEYRDKLLKIKGKWLSLHEIIKNRQQVEKQIAKRLL